MMSGDVSRRGVSWGGGMVEAAGGGGGHRREYACVESVGEGVASNHRSSPTHSPDPRRPISTQARSTTLICDGKPSPPCPSRTSLSTSTQHRLSAPSASPRAAAYVTSMGWGGRRVGVVFRGKRSTKQKGHGDEKVTIGFVSALPCCSFTHRSLPTDDTQLHFMEY